MSASETTGKQAAGKAVPPRNPPGAVRHPALAVRRNVRGAVSHAGLRLRQLRAGGGALQGRGSGLPVFPLRQSDRGHAGKPDGGVRGRGGGARHCDRHGGGDAGAGRTGEGRRSCRGLARAVRLLPLRRRGLPATLRRDLDHCRRQRPAGVARRRAAQHQDVLPRKPDQPDARGARHRGDREDRPCRRRDARGRQRVLDAAVAEPARTGRGLRGLFGDQAHRRPGPLSRRADPRLREVHHGQRPCAAAADRPVDVAVQRLGHAQRAGNAAGARASADRKRRQDRRRAGRPSARCRG